MQQRTLDKLSATTEKLALAMADVMDKMHTISNKVDELSSSSVAQAQTSPPAVSKTSQAAKLRLLANSIENDSMTPEEAFAVLQNTNANIPNAPAFAHYPREERLKAEDVSWLDPDYPEKFIAIMDSLESYGEEAVLRAVHRSMTSNNNELVSDWYSTILHEHVSSQNRIDLRSINGVKRLIRTKFGKSTFAKTKDLEQVRWSWDEDVSRYVTKILRLCAEAGETSQPTIMLHIAKHLPLEFTTGLNFDNFKTVGALEAELKGRQFTAIREHRAKTSLPRNRRGFGESDAYRTSTEGKKDNQAQPPAKPCKDCGTFHWKNGPYATSCPPKQKEKYQTEKYDRGRTPERTYYSDAEQTVTETGSESDFFDNEVYLSEQFDNAEDAEMVDYSSHDNVAVLLTEDKTAKDGESKVIIRAKAIGPIPSQHSYKMFQIQQIPIRLGDQFGNPKYRPVDSCCSMNIVSRRYLEKYHPSASIEEKDDTHGKIAGIVKDQTTQSNSGCHLKLLVVMRNGEDVEIEGYFHILEEFAHGLLLGQETIATYGFIFDTQTGNFSMKGAPGRVGSFLFQRSADQVKRPVRMAMSMTIPPGTHGHVPIKMKPYKSDMLFTGKTFEHSSFRQEAHAAAALISTNTQMIRFANFGDTPIRLQKGSTVGWVEKVHQDNVCLFSQSLATLSPSVTVPEIPETNHKGPSVHFDDTPSPWSQTQVDEDLVALGAILRPKTKDSLAKAKEKSSPCCRSKEDFVLSTRKARGCVSKRARRRQL